jgi:probable F420-dependent oxidoreductase
MLTPQADPADTVSIARQAEAQGFDYLACGEHVLFHGPTTNAFVSLAAAAAVTERLRLLSAVTLVPLYPAALLAKMATTLDRVCAGRFDLGVGVGGEFPPEYAACGIPLEERGARTDEFLQLFRALVGDGEVSFRGRFASSEGRRLEPDPIQPGGPPIWIGGRSPAARRRAGRYGHHWLPYMVSPDQLEAGLREARAAAESLGRLPGELSGALFAWSAVGTDPSRARRTALETLRAVYRQDFDAKLDRYVPAGNPAQVTERLAEYVGAGASTVVVSPACGEEELPAMTASFAEEVLPELRRMTPPAAGEGWIGYETAAEGGADVAV